MGKILLVTIYDISMILGRVKFVLSIVKEGNKLNPLNSFFVKFNVNNQELTVVSQRPGLRTNTLRSQIAKKSSKGYLSKK
jgi:hypothetical protein